VSQIIPVFKTLKNSILFYYESAAVLGVLHFLPFKVFIAEQGILSTARGLNALQHLDSLDRSLLMVCLNCCLVFSSDYQNKFL
jgi:hypothetical protein